MASAVELLAEIISENNPASPHCQAGLHDDIKKDGQSNPATDFTSSILAPTVPTAHGIGLARISGKVFQDNEEHCRCLDGCDLSHAIKERFVNVLCDVQYGRLISAPLQH